MDETVKTESGITVINESGFTIEVAINHWEDGGSTNYWPIVDQAREYWTRVDDRGFVMVIKQLDALPDLATFWFVRDGSVIHVKSLFEAPGSLASLPNPYNHRPDLPI